MVQQRPSFRLLKMQLKKFEADLEYEKKQRDMQLSVEQRRIEDMRQHANKMSHDRYGRSLKSLTLDERLALGSSMLRNGYASRCESFAKALLLTKEDVDRLL